jgi:beta-mannosidase
MRKSVTIGSWQARQYDCALPDGVCPEQDGEWFSAVVPGAIQYDLAARGKLENPYASTRAAFDSAWVAQSDWLYRAVFETGGADAVLNRGGGFGGALMLRIKGVDTFSEVWLNGALVGETADAMRVYDFPVKREQLLPGKNTLLVRVKAHSRMIADKLGETDARLRNGKQVEGLAGKSLIRRYQRSFFAGSSLLNLGTGVLGIGINREVELIVYSGAYLSDLFFRAETISAREAAGKVYVTAENIARGGPPPVLKLTIRDARGGVVFSAEQPLAPGEGCVPVRIENPKLWQPAGYGEAYLYDLKAEVIENGETAHCVEQKIGIRAVELVRQDDSGKKTFYFKVNGRKIIVHGQNHIPPDYIKSYGSREEYERLFRLLENQGVNCIRIWGGGVAEDDWYYDQCDRLGILIWHDMFLHSNLYPDYDPDFVQAFLAECEGILRQVRRHPCLALICGGNEQQEGWDEWGWKQQIDRFYGEDLPRVHLPPVAASYCPDIPYIYNSPHGGQWSQSPIEGECHNWGNFYNSTKDPLFVTETCWTSESYSRPETLKKYMDLDVDEFSGNGWLDKWKERTSLGFFRFLPYSNWHHAENLREYLHTQELEQMRADYSALSMYRFESPSNNGVIYWSHNKGGPLFQFGCVDYGGYPLMSYYAVKRVFAPIAVHACREVSDITVMISSHGSARKPVRIEARHLGKAGEVKGRWEWHIDAVPGAPVRAARLEGLYDTVRDRAGEAFYIAAFEDGSLVSDDMLFFCPFSEYEGEYHPLDIGAEKTGGGSWRLSIAAKTPVRLVELESSQKLLFSDDYFPLVPGVDKTIEVSLLEKTTDGPVTLTARILGSDKIHRLELQGAAGVLH